MADVLAEIDPKDLLTTALAQQEEPVIIKPVVEAKQDDPPSQQNVPEPPKTKSLADFTDDELAEHLRSRGKTIAPITSNDSGPQLTEKEKVEKRNAEKFKYALDNKIFTIDQWNNFQAASHKSPQEIVWTRFLDDNKSSGRTFEQLEADFKKLYYIEHDDDFAHLSERRKKDLEREAAQILKSEYPEIYSLDKKFDAYETEQQTNTRVKAEKLQKTTAYNSNVQQIFSGLNKKTFSIKVDDNNSESFDFELLEPLMAELKTRFLSEGVAAKLLDNTPEEIQEAIDAAILKMGYNQILSFGAKFYHEKKLGEKIIGRKHMNPEDVPAGDATIEREDNAYQLLNNHPAVDKAELNGAVVK
jgi:hypothetical protein